MSGHVSRRNLLAGSSAAAVLALASTACGGDGGQPDDDTTGSPRPNQSEELIARARSAAEASIGQHLGELGRTLFASRITQSDYIAALAAAARGFVCAGTSLNVEVETGAAVDVGGQWANDLVMSAPVTENSANQVVEFVRAHTHDKEVRPGLVAFGYNRFLDVGASSKSGTTALGHRSVLILLSGVDLTPPPSPSAVDSPPAPSPGDIYILTRAGVTKVNPAASAEQATGAFSQPRVRRSQARLGDLVGVDSDGKTVFYSLSSEGGPLSGVDAAAEGWPDGEVEYTAATVGDSPARAAATPPSSTSGQVEDAPFLPPAQAAVAGTGTIASSRHALSGTPQAPQVVPSIEVRWGPPREMPGYNYLPNPWITGAARSGSSDSCENAVTIIWAAAWATITLSGNACVAEVLLIAVPCGPFYLLCAAAGLAVCAAVLAAAAVVIDQATMQARRACNHTIPCTDPEARCR